MENSAIEWCDHTVNLWWGCYEVHAGCDNCYAKQQSNRYHGPHLLWQQQGPRMEIKSAFSDLKLYQARAEKEDKKYFIFMNSMSDIFEKPMPLINFVHEPAIDSSDGSPVCTDYLRDKFFNEISERKYENLIFLLLTKRPSNILKMIPLSWIAMPPHNVIYGTSVIDQETANTLIPQLVKVPGKRFLSMEPLLGSVDLMYKVLNYGISGWLETKERVAKKQIEYRQMGFEVIPENPIHWIIVGGESGGAARPMHPDWACSLRDQCQAAGVPFFFKQWGEFAPHMNESNPPKTSVVHNGIGYEMCKVGKKAAGSLLNEREWKEFPNAD